MPKAGADYSPKTFKSLTQAYNRYTVHRMRETGGGVGAVAPRDKFAKIWGWGKTPGKRARQALAK